MLNYHLRRRYREDIPRGRNRGVRRGRETGSSEIPRVRPEIRARGSLSLSRKRITKRNIVEPYISDGALMKHSRSRHSEITRDRLDYSRAGTPGCSLPFPPFPPAGSGAERERELRDGSPRSLMRIREHPRRLILEPADRL